ncbi:MAG: hypothetical protein PHS44_06755 [Candidatus Dojkabacteria bacterium]|jgi:hypothetical protein|nr:hypothetical protein [Candidatus Dojkabacteria bacterium]
MEEEVFPGQLKEEKFYQFSGEGGFQLFSFQSCNWLAAIALGLRIGQPIQTSDGIPYGFSNMRNGLANYFCTGGRYSLGLTRGEDLRVKIKELFVGYGITAEDTNRFKGTVKRNMRTLKSKLRGFAKKMVGGVPEIGDYTYLFYLKVDRTGNILNLEKSYSVATDEAFCVGIRSFRQGDAFPVLSVALPEGVQLDSRTRGVIDVTLTLINLDLLDF